jgi:hypothetical protein
MLGDFDVRTALAAPGQTTVEVVRVPELEAGFHLLYELKFEEARNQFEAWQKSHPADPLASASRRAICLRCAIGGVLSSEFFLDDKRFIGKIPLKPDPKLRAAFFAAVKRARDLAQCRLKTSPDDTNALFAMALSLGMQADYASLIDKQQFDRLKMIRDADKYAKKLLMITPDAADAYLGMGTANCVAGSLPRYKQFLLGRLWNPWRQECRHPAARDRGHYLRPFAKILLALVALREKKTEVARAQLKELVKEFPENPPFPSELAKIKAPAVDIPPRS